MNDNIAQLEESVIGAVLINPDTLSLLPSLETADFRNFKPRAVWDAIRNLAASNSPIDVVTVGDELKRLGKLDAVGFDYLGACALTVPTVSNAIEYAARLRDSSLRYRLIEALSDSVDKAKLGELTGLELAGAAFAAASGVDASQPEKSSTIGELVTRRIREIERQESDRQNGGRALTGFTSGVAALDATIGGWQPGIASIIAARPAMGKSSLGLATADACSWAGVGVHLFSLEDTEASYADRAMARDSRVPAENIRNCKLDRGQFDGLQNAMRRLATRRHWLFDGRSGITAEEIVRSVRRRMKENQTRVVIVDYVQLVRKPNPRMSPHEALGEIITTLADAAKADGMAYVVMSQLNREIEKRDDKRPMLSDLRESGSLEERAKCVIGVYRGSAYKLPPKRGVDFHCDCKYERGQESCGHAPSDEKFASQVQLIVMKNSNGRTGIVPATWHGPTTRME